MGRETTILAFLGKYIDENFKNDYVPPKAVGFFEAGFQAGEDYTNQSAWISVEDRLPVNNDNVLVMIKGESIVGGVWLGFYDPNHLKHYPILKTINAEWFVFGATDPFEVTHWRPRPQPPKESK